MFIGHEVCPKCRDSGRDRSGNNLGVWDDHKFCFSCKYYEDSSGRSLEFLKTHFQSVESTNNNNDGNIDFPSDCSGNIRIDALAWIKKYGITDLEIEKNSISWSDRKQMLVFPLDIRDNVVHVWHGRYFGVNKEYPKYLTKGTKNDLYHILGENDETLVICEDLISAIKISRKYKAMPMFGSSLNRRQMFHIANFFGYKNSLTLWFDPDKTQDALRLKTRAEFYFNHVGVVVSDADPKDHSDMEIESYVRKSLS